MNAIVKTFRGPDPRTALDAVRSALGEEAIILKTREVGGFFGRKEIEITATHAGRGESSSSYSGRGEPSSWAGRSTWRARSRLCAASSNNCAPRCGRTRLSRASRPGGR